MGSVDPAEVQSCRLEPRKNKGLQKIDKEEWKDKEQTWFSLQALQLNCRFPGFQLFPPSCQV